MRYLTIACCLVAFFELAAQEKVLPVAQEMPVLKACGDIEEPGKRKACSDEKIAMLLTEHLRYPAEAVAAKIEGHVIVRFTVDEKGKTLDYTVDDDPGYGLGAAAIEAVNKLGRWIPGKNMGEEVKVRMAIPVKFELPKAKEMMAIPEPDVYVVAEQMPRFQGCAEGDESAGQSCTFTAILDYTRQNLVYPEAAKQEKVEGDVVVKFVVDTEGKVTDVTVVQGLGKGCDEEAVSLVKSMPPWIPGMHQGKKVKVELTLPFRFAISEKE